MFGTFVASSIKFLPMITGHSLRNRLSNGHFSLLSEQAGPLAVPNPVDATETPSEGSGGDSGGGDSRGTAVGSRGGGKTGIPVDREGGGEDADGESDDGSGTGRDEAQERLAPTTRSRARMQSVETGTSAVARTTRGQGKSGSPPRSSRRRRSTVTVKASWGGGASAVWPWDSRSIVVFPTFRDALVCCSKTSWRLFACLGCDGFKCYVQLCKRNAWLD